MNIFLLRGLIREKAHWGSFVDEMQQAFPDAGIHTPEIPGVGEFHEQTSPDNFDDMIDFMREKHTTLFGDDRENLLIAMSLGGMIARQWMEKFPKDFKRVVLVNTSFRGLNPLYRRLKPSSMLRFLRIFFTPGMEAREHAILRMVSNNHERNEKIVRDWIEIQSKRPVSRQSFMNQIKAALTFHPPLTKPEADLLILAAKGDRLCDYRSSEKLHETWEGTLLLHPSAGHDLPVDDAAWMIEQIKTWLSESN